MIIFNKGHDQLFADGALFRNFLFPFQAVQMTGGV